MKRMLILAAAVSAVSLLTLADIIRDSLGARTIGYTEGGEGIVPVEYLESTGREWINTGVNPGLDFSIEALGMRAADYTKNAAIFSNEGGAAYVDIIYSTGYWTLRCYGATLGVPETTEGYQYARCVFNFTASPTTLLHNNGRNGQQNTAKTEEQILGSTNPVILFRGPYNKTNPVRIAMFRMWKDGELAIDLAPVRIGSEGMMLDKVTGELFRNQGTGAFLVGPDVAE